MNFLAHLYLADDTAESVIGNLLGDFKKGLIDDCYPPDVNQGIRLHRAVDAYTDRHEEFSLCRGMLPPEYRRFAGIIVDMFWDHFLAENWGEYSSEPLEAFSQRMYDYLQHPPCDLPERMVFMVNLMEREDLLTRSRDLKSLAIALHRVGDRLDRGPFFEASIEQLKQNYEALDESFRRYFPQLIQFAASFE
jgi:acyl carrier protein phosphodiesterase